MASTARFTLKGLGPFDGVYDRPEEFDLGELFFIEQTAGIKAGEIGDAMRGGSVGLLACVIAIALKRAGFDVPMEVLWGAKDENIEVDQVEQDEDEGRPLDSPTSGGDENEP